MGFSADIVEPDSPQSLVSRQSIGPSEFFHARSRNGNGSFYGAIRFYRQRYVDFLSSLIDAIVFCFAGCLEEAISVFFTCQFCCFSGGFAVFSGAFAVVVPKGIKILIQLFGSQTGAV